MDDGSCIHEDEGVAHFPQFRENMGADEQRFSTRFEQMHQIFEFKARFRVQSCRRFIQNEELRVADQRTRQAEPLRLPF